MAANFTGPQRIERMVAYFNAEAELATDNTALMDVDIIGYSRGGAEARDFANRINANTRNGQYSYTVMVNGQAQLRCQMINFRFLGLWDTVLSTNLSGTRYQLDVVPGFQHVAQAVALNEYRGDTFRRLSDSTGAFPLESIMGSILPVGQTRIEMGFLGAHADIGGGLGTNNELSRVALSWMIEQAKDAGVKMREEPNNYVPANVVIHDKSDNQYCVKGPGCSEDREVRGGEGGTFPVAGRIPDEIAIEIRKHGGGLRLKFRLKPDGVMFGWDIERFSGGLPRHSMPGGDFLETWY